MAKGKPWLDPQLLTTLTAVEHHLEVIDDRDAKLLRLKALIQKYVFLQDQQLTIVANSANVRRVLDMVSEYFKDVDCKALDCSTPDATKRKSMKSFETGETSILVMASEISTRRDFDFTKPAAVLVNFDFPLTLQLYLHRLFKRAESNTHVYTFFSPQYNIRNTVPLVLTLEGAKQKVPPALQKLKDQMKNQGKRNACDVVTKKGCLPSEIGEVSSGRHWRGRLHSGRHHAALRQQGGQISHQKEYAQRPVYEALGFCLQHRDRKMV